MEAKTEEDASTLGKKAKPKQLVSDKINRSENERTDWC